jgi:hypothetical protein
MDVGDDTMAMEDSCVTVALQPVSQPETNHDDPTEPATPAGVLPGMISHMHM